MISTTTNQKKLTLTQKLAVGGALSAIGAGALAGLNTSSVHAAVNHSGNAYQIAWGDTLAGIAANNGTTVEALAAENGIANPNLIYAGQTLYIPQGGSAGSADVSVQQAPAPEAPAQSTSQVVETPVQTQAPVQSTQAVGGSYESMIRSVFGVYGDQAMNIAMCESTMNPNAYNGILGAAGLFQIIPGTFASTSVGQSGASVYDPQANIRAAYEIFHRDGNSWAEWACHA